MSEEETNARIEAEKKMDTFIGSTKGESDGKPLATNG